MLNEKDSKNLTTKVNDLIVTKKYEQAKHIFRPEQMQENINIMISFKI